MRADLTLTHNMAFDVDIDGHHFPIDAKAEHGGDDTGASPKALILAGLAGCGAMDVISIVRKMRQPVTAMRVSADGRQTEGEHPHVLVDLVVTFDVEGDIQPERLWRAVALSRDRYCGVAAMLRAHAPIEYRVRLNGQDVPEPG